MFSIGTKQFIPVSKKSLHQTSTGLPITCRLGCCWGYLHTANVCEKWHVSESIQQCWMKYRIIMGWGSLRSLCMTGIARAYGTFPWLLNFIPENWMWWYFLHVEEIQLFSSRKMVDFAGWRYAYASLTSWTSWLSSTSSMYLTGSWRENSLPSIPETLVELNCVASPQCLWTVLLVAQTQLH